MESADEVSSVRMAQDRIMIELGVEFELLFLQNKQLIKYFKVSKINK